MQKLHKLQKPIRSYCLAQCVAGFLQFLQFLQRGLMTSFALEKTGGLSRRLVLVK